MRISERKQQKRGRQVGERVLEFEDGLGKTSGSKTDASLVSETTINGAIGPWREEGGWFSDKHETRERENEDTEYNRNRSLAHATLPASSQQLADWMQSEREASGVFTKECPQQRGAEKELSLEKLVSFQPAARQIPLSS